jgi:hypothetical protein
MRKVDRPLPGAAEKARGVISNKKFLENRANRKKFVSLT